jgi:hypothetical protein
LRSTEKRDDEGQAYDYSIVENKLNDLKMETQTPGIGSISGDTSITRANIDRSNSINDELDCVLNEKELNLGEVDDERGPFINEENPSLIGDGHFTVSQQKVSFIKVLMIFYF